MKKFIVVLVITMLLSGCGNDKGTSDTPSSNTSGASTEMSSTVPSDKATGDKTSSNETTVKLKLYTNDESLSAYPDASKESTITIDKPTAMTAEVICKAYKDHFFKDDPLTFKSITQDEFNFTLVDFTREGANFVSSGSYKEMMILNGLARSIIENFPDTKGVCYGIENGDYESGHQYFLRSEPYLKAPVKATSSVAVVSKTASK